jgi:hypothetical protein
MGESSVASIASGPFLAACVVLAVAGVKKLRRPDSAVPALAAVGLPASTTTARVVGAGEVVIAGAGAVFGGVAALAVAAMYLLLAIVAARLLRRAPSTPCGCLGASDAPASRAHVAVNVAAALISLAAATGPSPFTYMPESVLGALTFIVLVATLAGCTALMVDAQPALRAAMQRGQSK